MKPFHSMMETGKGRLLHQLFPATIPAFLNYVLGICEAIKEQPEQQREKWSTGLSFGMPFDFALPLVNDIPWRIERYGKKLHTNSRLFADQLFDGFHSLFTVYCLRLYVTTRIHPDEKFVTAVDLLFTIPA